MKYRQLIIEFGNLLYFIMSFRKSHIDSLWDTYMYFPIE